ncbi:MAG: thioredoxin family protein [Deltaproteobacteria bacterium]|nr:thioredoxin family protein [Deltaproteobacteria bacterium]
MSKKRIVEVFSAGCSACQATIDLVNEIACGSCEISILDMNDAEVARRAKSLGIRQVPAVVVDGVLAACCANAGPTEEGLRAAGIGSAA